MPLLKVLFLTFCLPTDSARGAAERRRLRVRGGFPPLRHHQLDADRRGLPGRRQIRLPQRDLAALLTLRS